MRLLEVEEPSSPTSTAHAPTSSSDPEAKDYSLHISNDRGEDPESQLDEDREAHLRRIAKYYDMMKNMDATENSIKSYLQEMLQVWWSELRMNGAVQKELDIWASEFKAAMYLDRELDKAKKDPMNTDETHTWETDERLQVERDELFASVIDFVEGQMDIQEIEQLPKLPRATGPAD